MGPLGLHVAMGQTERVKNILNRFSLFPDTGLDGWGVWDMGTAYRYLTCTP